MTRALIVHLSDLHIRDTNDKTLGILALLPGVVSTEIEAQDQVIIVLSGDLAFSGQTSEYDALKSKLEAVKVAVQAHSSLRVQWVMVPGNHDGKFKNSTKNRLNNIAIVLKEGESSIDQSVVETCTAPQIEYFNFQSSLVPKSELVFQDSLLSIHSFKVGEKTVCFWAFNVSWMSRVPEIQGDLVFPVSIYQEKLQLAADYRFAVLHHPLNWYTQSTYHPFREFLTRNFCSILSGHEHVSNGFLLKEIGHDSTCAILEAGALGPHDATHRSEFALCILDLEAGNLSYKKYKHQDLPSRFETFNQSVHQVKLSGNRDLEVTDATRDALEEMGAPFAHPARDELKLSDVYIEPQFSVLSYDEEGPETIQSSVIYARLPELKKILIRGDEHFGKTSFLNRLFFRSLAAGLVPLRVGARELANGSDEQRDRILATRMVEQFGANSVRHFDTKSKDLRLVLIDDLDKLGMQVASYERVLSYIEKRFGNVVLTVGDRFDVSLLGSTSVAQHLGSYEELRMLGFSYAMRSALIRRWYAIDVSLDSNQVETRWHEAESQIDYAVAKALVPSTAFNTLMILNALQATEKSQVVDAGVAQHYDMLMRRRLAASGASPKDLDGIYAYLSHMSWWLRANETTSLDKAELQSFNEYFTTKIHSIDSSRMVELLVKSRILSNIDGSTQFKHPSGRYFFLAHYIAEHAEEQEEAKNYALSACRRLYRKDNANLIVFLASKVASRWIVREVASVLNQLLLDHPVFDVIRDSTTLNNWVSRTARLAVEDENHEDHRRERSARNEEAQAIETAETEVSEVEEIRQLDLFTQITLVFKTSEILGLILKSRYGSLDAATKHGLITQIFDGPLRAISFFLNAINEQPDTVIEYVSKNWESKLPHLTHEQREKLAQRFLYFALGAYSQALLQRQGEIAGSPDLASYTNDVIKAVEVAAIDNNQLRGKALTYRLLGVATRLSYPNDVPFGEIERLAKELENNPFGFTLLQGVVATHLYMFSLSHSSRQRLAQAMKLDLKSQMAKDVMHRETKALPGRTFTNRNSSSLLARLQRSFLARNPRGLGK